MALKATPSSFGVVIDFLQAATDDVSGVASYVVVGRQGGTAPARCTGPILKKAQSGGLATTVAAPTAPAAVQLQSVSFSSLQASTPYSFRLCAVDNAGNVAQGVTIGTQTTP
jgi:hypothetical protein